MVPRSGTTNLRVLDSHFYDNTVVPAAWAKAATKSYSLRISTTSLTGAGMEVSPMWSIDDGPVHGVSADECEAACQASASGIDRGLAPSWPAGALCADVIYEPSKLYAHILELAEGDNPSLGYRRPENISGANKTSSIQIFTIKLFLWPHITFSGA
jgi:hypothetical protein